MQCDHVADPPSGPPLVALSTQTGGPRPPKVDLSSLQVLVTMNPCVCCRGHVAAAAAAVACWSHHSRGGVLHMRCGLCAAVLSGRALSACEPTRRYKCSVCAAYISCLSPLLDYPCSCSPLRPQRRLRISAACARASAVLEKPARSHFT